MCCGLSPRHCLSLAPRKLARVATVRRGSATRIILTASATKDLSPRRSRRQRTCHHAKLAQYKIISLKVNEAIKIALAGFGLDAQGVRATVNEETGEVNLRVIALDVNMIETPEEEVRWKANAIYYMLNPAWLGMTVNQGTGREAKILGMLNTRSDKNISLEMHGKKMVCTAEALRRMAKLAGLPEAEGFKPVEAKVIQ